jgi:hypothetical protein
MDGFFLLLLLFLLLLDYREGLPAEHLDCSRSSAGEWKGA